MKKIQYGIWVALMLLCFGCNDDDSLPKITPEDKGKVTIDGKEYGWVRYGGLDWMTSNLRAGTPYYEDEDYMEYSYRWDEWTDLIEYDDKDQAIADYEIYGNLYTYEKALENCPEGWRLPTDEDWQKLERVLGMSASVANSIGWRGNGEGELIQQDETGSGLNLLLAGCVSFSATYPPSWSLRFVRVYGFYWSGTVDETYEDGTAVYYRRIFANNPQIERNVTPVIERDYLHAVRSRLMSVRYVRDAK